MVISKHLTGSTPLTVNLANFEASGVAQVWRLNSSNVITQLADINFANASFTANLPAQSITLFVLFSGTAGGPLLLDEFEDNVQSWPVKKGSWVEANGSLTGTGNSTAITYAPQPWSPSGVSSCSTCTLETQISTTGGNSLSKIFVQPWYQDKTNRVDILFKLSTGKIILKQKVGGATAAKAKADFPVTPGISYNLNVSFDGSNFQLSIDGQQLITMPAAAVPSGNLYLKLKATTASFQSIHIY
jgi:hypothetical protein